MRIGIDIDGVLTDVYRFQIDYGSLFYNKRVVNSKAFKVNDMFGLPDSEERPFWDKYLFKYATEAKPRFYVKEALEELHKLGVEIYIITARFRSPEETEEGLMMRKTVIKWLQNNELYYDKIVFSLEHKDKRVEEYKIDLMIEDKPENISDVSKVCPVLVVDNPYNHDVDFNNIVRVYNWVEILSIIKNSLKKID